MTPTEALREIMAKRGITQEQLANLMNYANRSCFTNRIRNKNGVRLDFFAQCCDVMEYDIVLRDRVTQLELVIDDCKTEDKGEGYGYIKRDREGNLVAPGRRPKNDSVS